MFNIYIYEKRLKEKNIEEKEKEDKKIKDEIHIKKRDKLAQKFYNKTNKFLLEMIRKPIIINNNYYKPKENISNHSFCLYKFQTDRERINKLLKSENQYKIEYNKKSKKRKKRCQSQIKMNNNIINNQNFNDFNNNKKKYDIIYLNNPIIVDGDIINQPSMKFRPRNDLERILDSINPNKGLLIKNSKILKFNKDSLKENEEKELLNYIDKNIGMGIPYSIHSQNNSSIILEKKDKLNKVNKNKILKDKINLSNVVKNITEKYHSKTYFNSIEQAIIFNYHKHKNKYSKCNNIKNIINKYQKKKKIKINYSSSSIDLFPNLNDNRYKIEGFSDMSSDSFFKKQKNVNKAFRKKELIDNNINDISLDISYNNNKNDIIRKIIKLNNPELNVNKSNNLNQDKKEALMILKKMSINKSHHKIPFSSDRIKSQPIKKYKGFYLDYDFSNTFKKMPNLKAKNKDTIIEDDKFIIVNNYLYNKKNKNDLNDLGKIVLQKCHFVNTKYDNDENNQLKKGKGKLMITNGLSVNEFLNKHSLPK